MKRRRFLRISVKLGLLAGALVFTGVLLQGMFSPARLSGETVALAGIAPGSARLEAWDGRPVWIVNRSDSQLAGIASLSEHVFTPAAESGSPVNNVLRSLEDRHGVYLASTARPGVLVQYVPGRPDRLAADIPWHGGFVDPGTGALFDVAGRRYRTTRGEPLEVPPHRYVGPRTIRLGEW